MAVYGITFYGTNTYGAPTFLQFDSGDFRAIPEGYDSLRLRWTTPSDAEGTSWEAVRLVRSSYGFPVTAYDGVVLFEDLRAGARTSFLDTELQPGRFYYYSLLVRLADGSWKVAGQTFELVTAGHSNGRKLWELLPEFYREADYDYRGVHDEGPLYRFLDMLGYQLDRVRTEVDSLLDVANIDRVSGGLLPVLAESLGVTYEPELGMRASRSIIQNAIHLAKTKGTRPGIEGVASAYTSFGATAVVGKNLLFDRNHSGWVDEGLNLFPASQRGFGTGVGTWTNAGNATLDTVADGGDMRLRLTALAAGDVAATTPAGDSGFAVEAGTFYDFVAYAKSVGTSRQIQVSVTFYDAAGTAQGTTSSTAAAAQTTSWTRFGVAALAPSGAVYASVGVKVLAAQAADETLVDDIAFTQAPVSHWVATQNASLGRRSEVSTTPAVPGTGSLVVVGGSLAATNAVVLSGTFADCTLIAVEPNTDYTASAYVQHEGTARDVTVGVVFYDIDGTALLTADSVASANPAAWDRRSVTATSPANAAWAAIRFTVTTPGQDEAHLFGAVQLEGGGAVTAWESGRQVNVYLEPERRNLVTNPSFENDAAAWSALPGSTIARTTAEAWSGDAALSVVKDDSEDPTFTRASTAHLDGVGVASGTPRYAYGRNLLSKDAAAVLSTAWWAVYGGGGGGVATLTMLPGGGHLSGDAVRATWTAPSTGGGGPYTRTRWNDAPTNRLPCVPGQTYSFRASMRTSVNGAQLRIVPHWYTASSMASPSTSAMPTTTAVADQWHALTMTATAPANAVYMAVACYIDSATPIGATLDVSNVQVEVGSTATPWRPGGPSAILIEEGTTNLLTLTQSQGGDDGTTTGFAGPNGTTIAASTEQAWQGTRSIKATLPAYGSGNGVGVGLSPALTSLAADTTYTFSAYVLVPATGGVDVKLSIQGTGVAATVNGPVIAERGRWVRTSVTFTTDADGGTIQTYILNGATTTGGEVFYTDGWQLEQKAYATSWQPGGVARQVDRLTIPSESFPSSGTLEIDAFFVDKSKVVADTSIAGSRALFSFRWTAPAGDTFMQLFRRLEGGLMLESRVGGQTKIFSISGDIAEGWHRAAVAWSESGMEFYIDGVVVASFAGDATYPTINTTIDIGKGFNRFQWNDPIDAIRISSRARTAAELADATTPLAPDEDTTWFQDFAGDLEYFNDNTIGAVLDPIDVAEGLAYTGSFLAKGTVPRNVRAAIEWLDVGSSVLATTEGSIVVEVEGDWVRCSASGIAPAGAVSARLVAQVVGGAASTDTHFFDGVLFEQTEFVKEYFDASLAPTADYLWDGTPHASASFRYPRRDTKDARLRTVLPDYTPAGVEVQTVYGEVAPASSV